MAGFTPSIWFTLTPDGKVTMHIVKAEMGQHIGTGLAQVIAEELEVKWDDVRLDSPLESVENFAIYGLAYTVNSGSVTTEFDRLSRAGAAGRMALIEAGAKVLGAKEADCTAANSRVIDSVSGRSISYGEIIQKVKIDRKFAYPEDFKAIKLKAPGDLQHHRQVDPGPRHPVQDQRPGQVRHRRVPAEHGVRRARHTAHALRLQSAEHRRFRGAQDSGIHQGREGGRQHGQVHRLGRRAGREVPGRCKSRSGPEGQGRSRTLRRARHRATCSRNIAQTTKNAAAGANWVLEGDVDKALAGAEKVLEMEYTTDMVCHATMEPLNATVQFVDGAWHVYSGTQSTSFARMTLTAYLSKVLGQKPEDIKIYVHESVLGGGFGGKQDYDEILAAAYCAKEVGRPVKLIQTRESTFATSFPRTPTYHKLKAGLKNGQLVAMDHDICCGWMGPRFSVGKKYGTDWLQLDSWDAKKEDIDQWSIGGSDHWYDVENHRVRAFDSERTTWAVQASALRTVSNSYNMFVVELFMDEVAHALNRDPLEFRLALLNGKGSSPRHSQCRIRAGHVLGLLHGSAVDLAAVAERQLLAGVRVDDRRRSVTACQLPAGRGRKSRLGREEAAAQHRNGHRRVLGRGAAEPDLGRRHRGGDGRSQDRPLQDQPAHDRYGSGHGDQSAQCQGANPGRSPLGCEPGHGRAADLQGRRARAEQLPRLHADPPGGRAADRCGTDRFGPSPERRRRARVHGRGAGGRQRDLQCGRRTRAAYADHGGGGFGGIEKEGVIVIDAYEHEACTFPGEA